MLGREVAAKDGGHKSSLLTQRQLHHPVLQHRPRFGCGIRDPRCRPRVAPLRGTTVAVGERLHWLEGVGLMTSLAVRPGVEHRVFFGTEELLLWQWRLGWMQITHEPHPCDAQ